MNVDFVVNFFFHNYYKNLCIAERDKNSVTVLSNVRRILISKGVHVFRKYRCYWRYHKGGDGLHVLWGLWPKQPTGHPGLPDLRTPKGHHTSVASRLRTPSTPPAAPQLSLLQEQRKNPSPWIQKNNLSPLKALPWMFQTQMFPKTVVLFLAGILYVKYSYFLRPWGEI